MRPLPLLCLLCLPGLLACAGPAAGGRTSPPRAATPAGPEIQSLALRADRLRVDTEGLGTHDDVAAVFTGPAAELIRAEELRSVRLRQHFEIAVTARAVVSWRSVPAGGSAVVQTSGRERLVGASGASAWANFVDEWEYTLRWSGGWRVWAALDLPPGQWQQ